ncbi:MAG: hypothetical protein WC472_04135 [Candidatus Paceibacterota bacterium]
MEIQFLQKVVTPGGVRLSYNIDNKKIYLEISGTAMSSYEVYDLSDKELGMIFIPIMTDIYDDLKEQGAELEKIIIDSEGAKKEGKIVYTKEAIEEVLQRRTRRLVNGEYWEIIKSDTGEGKPYKLYNTHQNIYEISGTYNPDFIDSFTDKQSALDFLWKQ